MMFEIVRFYFNVIANLITGLWDKLEISDGVNYTTFFIGAILMCAFIKLLKLGFENHGIWAFSRYLKKESKESNK